MESHRINYLLRYLENTLVLRIFLKIENNFSISSKWVDGKYPFQPGRLNTSFGKTTYFGKDKVFWKTLIFYFSTIAFHFSILWKTIWKLSSIQDFTAQEEQVIAIMMWRFCKSVQLHHPSWERSETNNKDCKLFWRLWRLLRWPFRNQDLNAITCRCVEYVWLVKCHPLVFMTII